MYRFLEPAGGLVKAQSSGPPPEFLMQEVRGGQASFLMFLRVWRPDAGVYLVCFLLSLSTLSFETRSLIKPSKLWNTPTPVFIVWTLKLQLHITRHCFF